MVINLNTITFRTFILMCFCVTFDKSKNIIVLLYWSTIKFVFSKKYLYSTRFQLKENKNKILLLSNINIFFLSYFWRNLILNIKYVFHSQPYITLNFFLKCGNVKILFTFSVKFQICRFYLHLKTQIYKQSINRYLINSVEQTNA